MLRARLAGNRASAISPTSARCPIAWALVIDAPVVATCRGRRPRSYRVRCWRLLARSSRWRRSSSCCTSRGRPLAQRRPGLLLLQCAGDAADAGGRRADSSVHAVATPGTLLLAVEALRRDRAVPARAPACASDATSGRCAALLGVLMRRDWSASSWPQQQFAAAAVLAHAAAHRRRRWSSSALGLLLVQQYGRALRSADELRNSLESRMPRQRRGRSSATSRSWPSCASSR